jgi:hypothetical protein
MNKFSLTLPGKSVFSPPKPQMPPPAPPVPEVDTDAETQKAKKGAQAAAKKRKGFLSTQTNVGGGLGVSDAPTVERKTLGS